MAIEVGAKLQGKVTGITHFGAFVELDKGITGLVHISEIDDNYVRDVKDHIQLQEMVTVKVINVDKDGKIGLSIKQAKEKSNRSKAISGSWHGSSARGGRTSFEDKVSRFLKDSEEKMTTLKRSTEVKRGGKSSGSKKSSGGNDNDND